MLKFVTLTKDVLNFKGGLLIWALKIAVLFAFFFSLFQGGGRGFGEGEGRGDGGWGASRNKGQ